MGGIAWRGLHWQLKSEFILSIHIAMAGLCSQSYIYVCHLRAICPFTAMLEASQLTHQRIRFEHAV